MSLFCPFCDKEKDETYFWGEKICSKCNLKWFMGDLLSFKFNSRKSWDWIKIPKGLLVVKNELEFRRGKEGKYW